MGRGVPITATDYVSMVDPKPQFCQAYGSFNPSPNSEKHLSLVSLSVLLEMS